MPHVELIQISIFFFEKMAPYITIIIVWLLPIVASVTINANRQAEHYNHPTKTVGNRYSCRVRII